MLCGEELTEAMAAADRCSDDEETVETRRRTTRRLREHHGSGEREKTGLDRFRDDRAVVLIMMIEMCVVDNILCWFVVSWIVSSGLFVRL